MGCAPSVLLRSSSSNNPTSSGDQFGSAKQHRKLQRYIATSRSKNLATSSSQKHGCNSSTRNVNILLLGAGESGKSTIAKQMKIIHDGGYNHLECQKFVPIIISNILSSLLTLFDESEKMNLEINCKEQKSIIRNFINEFEQKECSILKGVPKLPNDVVAAIRQVLMSPNVIKCIKEASKIGLSDSAAYFFSNFYRISDSDYIPRPDDILRTRVKTTGIYQFSFPYKSFKFTLTDVGGQKSERKKWIYCFRNVDVVLFVASLTDYCCDSEDDSNQRNKMSDSIELFRSLLNLRYFTNSTFVLILNKKDLFAQQLQFTPFSDYFPEFYGNNNYEDASKFVLEKYLACNKDENRFIYSHFSCATETSSVDFVFKSMADSLIKKDIEQMMASK